MELDLDAIEARHWHDESMRMCSLCMFEWPCDAVRMVAEVRRLRAQQCPHRSKTFGECIVCGWTGRPACSECGEPVRPDWECCSACGAWENALEATDG